MQVIAVNIGGCIGAPTRLIYLELTEYFSVVYGVLYVAIYV